MNAATSVTRDTWKQILASAVAILDDLERRDFPPPDIVMGGGTVLMFRFEHRLSRDIDFFLHDVQWITLLTPRLNDLAAAMVTNYVEQSNSIKLMLRHGDIDFVVAGSVSDAIAVEKLEFMGRTFLLEPTEEILAKKLFYRAERFQPRDAFDLLVAAQLDKESTACAMAAAASKRDILAFRVQQLSRLPKEKLSEGILPIGDFFRIIEKLTERMQRLLEDNYGSFDPPLPAAPR